MIGDWKALGVPAHHGLEAMRSLCAESDVIVSWLINPKDYGFTGRVIMVHHGPPIDREQTEASLQGDSIVCVSSETAEHIRTLTDRPVHWIPNAVDPSRLIATSQLELPAKKLCVWMHRFAKDKRPELAIAIAEHLAPDWQMVLAGGGMKLEGNDRVTILEPQHPGDLLSRASCFLTTSRFDGFGLSVAEAIAARVPVVSSPAGIATEPGLATIVPHDAEPSEWAAAIVKASEQSTRPQLPSEYGLDSHVQKWSSLILAR
jgi:glycosyltransferase involved in cell wall biosynthesis